MTVPRDFATGPGSAAREAIDSYVAAANSEFGESMVIADGLSRAYEVARGIGDQSRVAEVLDAVSVASLESLDADEPRPGVTLHLIKTLVSVPRAEILPVVTELLDAAERRYGTDPWHSSSIQELRSRIVEPAARAEIWRRAVVAYAQEARRSTGLRKYALLQGAIELAAAHDLTSDAELLRGELQGMSPEEFELHEVAVTATIPREEVDRYVNDVVGSDSLDEALARFGSIVPSGDLADNVEFARMQMREHPLRFFATGLRTGPENSLIRKLSTPDEHEAQAVVDSEQMRIAFFGLLAVDMLDAMRTAYGPIADRAEWFASDLIDNQVVSRVAVALERYESGDFDSAVSILAPRMERVLRRMAAALGLVVTRLPRANGQLGGVKGLGEILAAMKDRLPIDSYRYLWTLLCEPTAQNLRNRVGHGLADEFSQAEAALLIQSFCHVRGMHVASSPSVASPLPPLEP